MIIFIPTGQRYTARVRAKIVRLAHCEFCGQTFAYEIEIAAAGSSKSPFYLDNEGAKMRAHGRALRGLQAQAQYADAARACPYCYAYPTRAEAMLRDLQLRTLKWLSLLCLVPITIAFVVAGCAGLFRIGGHSAAAFIPAAVIGLLCPTFAAVAAVMYFGRSWAVSASTFNDEAAIRERAALMARNPNKRMAVADGEGKMRVLPAHPEQSAMLVSEHLDESQLRGEALARFGKLYLGYLLVALLYVVTAGILSIVLVLI